MAEKFKAEYEVSDGYVGKSRPLYFSIYADDIEDDMDETALHRMFDEAMQTAFDQNVMPVERCNSQERFVEWAKQIISNRKG